MGKETEDALTIIGGDGDDALSSHRIASISRFAATSCHQSTAIEVNEHWQMFLHRLGWSPDIQIETVLAVHLCSEVHISEECFLHRVRTIFGSLSHALPFLHRLGGLPTQIAYWWGCERYALEDGDA